MRYLLDTDCVIDHLHSITSTTDFIAQVIAGGHTLATCSVVLAETYTGLRQADIAWAEQLLSTCAFLPTSEDAARQAGRWRYLFRRQGITLSTTDCLIAATAQEHGATVITGNARHFQMPGVLVEHLPRVRQ